jgi:nucleoside-diphosphate-sugar epimerase
MKRKIVVVTGASGMVGRAIVRQLANCNYEIRCLSRSNVYLNNNIRYYKGDLGDKDLIDELMSGADIVFHCAAEKNDINIMHKVNLIGTENIINSANKSNIDYFCYISSVGVFGAVGSSKTINESCPCNPNNMYEKTKFEAENILRKFLKVSNLVILRPTNIIGYESSAQLKSVINSSLLGRILSCIKGRENAHLIDVDDVARAATHFINKKIKHQSIYIVSIDEDPNNIIYKLNQLLGGGIKFFGFQIKLPLIFPFYMRRIIGRTANYGDVIYDATLLKKTGFIFKFDANHIAHKYKNVAFKNISL